MKKLIFLAAGVTFVALMGFTPIRSYVQDSGVTQIGETEYRIETVNTISDEDNARLKTLIGDIYGIDIPTNGDVQLQYTPYPGGHSTFQTLVANSQINQGCLAVTVKRKFSYEELSLQDIIQAYL